MTNETDTAVTRLPVIRFSGDRERVKAIKLEWPVEVDGVVVETINVRRLTTGEVAAHAEYMRGNPNSGARWPMADQPDHVIDALDAVDGDAINRAIIDFLPRSFLDERDTE